MSHVTRLKGVKITDVRAVEAAVKKLQAKGIKCSLVTNQKPRVHGMDASPVCEYVLKLNGAYDVGLQRKEDGSYEPVFDTYQNHVGNQIGATCPMPNTAGGRQQHQMGQFLQAYAEEAARNQAAAQGYMVESSTCDAEGNVNLVLVGM
jgi:hypothetical protein